MSLRFNRKLPLWALGVLQPASSLEIRRFLKEVFDEAWPLPPKSEIDKWLGEWKSRGWITVVHEKAQLYSLTSLGNERLGKEIRQHRDKARLFLIKEFRDDIFKWPGKVRKRLAGDSPAEDRRSTIQEVARPIISADAPHSNRRVGRNYWPRLVEQLNLVGSEPHLARPSFQYYSFPSVKAIHSVSSRPAGIEDLSLNDFALAIGVSPRLLSAVIFKPKKYYRRFYLKKRGGGRRPIDAPRTFVKSIQYWILDHLLYDLPVHDSCHSYRTGRSIISNAQQHVEKNAIASLDIVDFFGSIKKGQIAESLKSCGFGRESAHIVAGLCTLNGKLPQGAPTSPVLSNWILREFDAKAHATCESEKAKYTRYADDITISGNSRRSVERAVKRVSVLLKENGFRLNLDKYRIASRGGQQRVTGVVVNEKVQPPREYRRRIRAMFHQAAIYPKDWQAKIGILRGHVNYLRSFPALRHSKEIKKYRSVLKEIEENRDAYNSASRS